MTDEEDYFAKENEVFQIFINNINEYLKKGYDVMADATHLTAAARNKVIKKLTTAPDEIEVIWIDIPLEVALKRNAERTGRAFVPEKVIKKMYQSIQIPAEKEISKYYLIKEDGKLIDCELQLGDEE